MTCPTCIKSRENARKAGHRDWAEGVCFDHAGVDWDAWLAARNGLEEPVVIGMETSGGVRDACVALGFGAVSVDLLPHQFGGAHHQGDVFAYLEARRTLPTFGVFHPECTYHTGSAAWAFKDADFERYPGVGYHMKLKPGTPTGAARRAAREAAEADVRRIRFLPFPKVIENPIGTLSTRGPLGAPGQIVQPYEFGSDASKGTCLWWFDAAGQAMPVRLPLGERIQGRMVEWPRSSGKRVERWANQTDSGQSNVAPHPDRWQHRSDTYPGIARAIAEAIAGLLRAPTAFALDDTLQPDLFEEIAA